jgi:glycosyltransferase involved in cell wall biosynthesis
MRLALAHSHARTLGGGERAVLELARRLAPRHQLRLLLGSFSPRTTYPELADFPHTRVPRLGWLSTRLPEDEVVVANSFGANLLALRNGPAVGYWVHSVRSVFLTRGEPRPDLLLRRLLDWLCVRRTGQLIANSHYTARALRRLYGREPDAVVYPGVDLELFRPASRTAASFALSVGRLAPEKGVDRLLEVWRELADLPLHVVGAGEPRLVRKLRRGAPAQVIFRGPLASAALAEAYRGACLAVFAARGEEFGIAPLEAMASGLPVVAWRQGGLLETVVDGETGFLAADEVTFRQRVRLLARDPDLRHRLGENARRRAEQFSWERTAAEMEAVCQRLASGVCPPDRASRP